jgi:serine/threonine protein phosphatase PrpC
MSEDHKPTREDEAKRIRDAGGFVINNRVMGELAVSRAFGDVDFKKGLQVKPREPILAFLIRVQNVHIFVFV